MSDKIAVDEQDLATALAYIPSSLLMAAGGPERSGDNAAAEHELAEALYRALDHLRQE